MRLRHLPGLLRAIVAQQNLDQHALLLDLTRRLLAQMSQGAINPFARLLAGAFGVIEQLVVGLPRLQVGESLPRQPQCVGGLAGFENKGAAAARGDRPPARADP